MAASRDELPQQFDAARPLRPLVVAFVIGRWHRFAKTLSQSSG